MYLCLYFVRHHVKQHVQIHQTKCLGRLHIASVTLASTRPDSNPKNNFKVGTPIMMTKTTQFFGIRVSLSKSLVNSK